MRIYEGSAYRFVTLQSVFVVLLLNVLSYQQINMA